MSDRPDISAELKRQILVEAGPICAIPTCRFPTTEIAHIELGNLEKFLQGERGSKATDSMTQSCRVINYPPQSQELVSSFLLQIPIQ